VLWKYFSIHLYFISILKILQEIFEKKFENFQKIHFFKYFSEKIMKI